jgi:hypothetical protein
VVEVKADCIKQAKRVFMMGYPGIEIGTVEEIVQDEPDAE